MVSEYLLKISRVSLVAPEKPDQNNDAVDQEIVVLKVEMKVEMKVMVMCHEFYHVSCLTCDHLPHLLPYKNSVHRFDFNFSCTIFTYYYSNSNGNN